ncbi:MAG: class I SAM-dependent methyltransferase [Bacteroidota bacterium]
MSQLSILLFRLRSFIRYKLSAIGPHALHSPFLFDLYNQVIKPARSFRIKEIELLRKELLKDDGLIEVPDFKSERVDLKSMRSIAKGSTSTKRFSAFLHLLIKYLKVSSILETGTSLGINTLYLAASSSEKITTIEGSKLIALHAQKNFDRFNEKNIRLVNGDLYKNFEQEVVRNKPDFYFLDADHRSSAIAFCIDLILKHTPNTKCIVIHDIYWSKDMSDIWQDLIEDPRFPLSLDIFQAGILFPNMDMPKQHFTLRF